jgi:hypothetical protein
MSRFRARWTFDDNDPAPGIPCRGDFGPDAAGIAAILGNQDADMMPHDERGILHYGKRSICARDFVQFQARPAARFDGERMIKDSGY